MSGCAEEVDLDLFGVGMGVRGLGSHGLDFLSFSFGMNLMRLAKESKMGIWRGAFASFVIAPGRLSALYLGA
jgi:hypothetical protein